MPPPQDNLRGMCNLGPQGPEVAPLQEVVANSLVLWVRLTDYIVCLVSFLRVLAVAFGSPNG